MSHPWALPLLILLLAPAFWGLVDVIQASGPGLSRVRWRATLNMIAGKFERSWVRVVLALFFSVVFWVGLYLLFRDGFRFLALHHLLVGRLIEALFGLFFASLLVMLIFSTAIILFASLFASEEALFLLVRPIAPDRVFAFKFQEAMFFSCWGFLLLGSPMIVAFGRTVGAPGSFYLISLLYFIAFALLPGSLGALACLLVANFMPRRRKHAVVGLTVLFVLFAAWRAFQFWQATRAGGLSRQWINRVLGGLGPWNLPFLPNHWISEGLFTATQTDADAPAKSLFFLLLLLSHGLFVYLITAYAYRRLYRRGYDRVHSESFARKRHGGPRIAAIVHTLFSPLPRPMRVLIVKDVQTFIRDPVQWSQVLIFCGLLGFYFLNLSRMTYYSDSPYWRNIIGFFNLAVTGLLLSTFTSRFIFPLLSLEGQRFWILGLCPMSRDAILWSKFWFATGGAVITTFTLTLIGAMMLQLDPFLIVLQLITVTILCFGLSGIAVGLGAKFPEMRQADPSKIAAGFGGTLNLVASLLFIFVVVLMMALPCHAYAVTMTLDAGRTELSEAASLLPLPTGISREAFYRWLTIALGANLAIGGLATYLPMRAGIRAFRDMDF